MVCVHLWCFSVFCCVLLTLDFEEGDIGLPGGAPRRMRMEELTLNGVRMQMP